MSSSSFAAATTTATASGSSQPSQYRAIGIVLAVGSGLLIGTSFVFKKRGLLKSQAGHAAGEGVAYLKSTLWWTGMIMMILGELCNFGAYAFVEAIVVTPLGALSVVISAILSHLLLKEKLTLFGWIGCTQCILGAIVIALNAPDEQSASTIADFKKLFLAPWFLAYGGCCIVAALVIIFYFAPKYGKKSMLWYISVCSLIGGLSVSCTQGLGACIVTTIRGENQFKNWFIYFLIVFVTCTLITEIFYLNVALALFNTAMVTPTYYVLFTFCTLVTSVILYQGLKASASQIITIVLAFLVICTGIFILQMSKVDPRRLQRLDRKTTILLQAAREEVNPSQDGDGAGSGNETDDEEKLIGATEEPGMDAVAGRFGGIGGTLVRARRRATIQGTFKGRRRHRAGTNASGPAVPGEVDADVESTLSVGIDSIRARELQEQWKEEKKRSTDAIARVFPASEERTKNGSLDEKKSIDGLPPGTSRPSQLGNGHTNDGNGHSVPHFLSGDPLATSPIGTPMSELNRTTSVHFHDQPRPDSSRTRTTSLRNNGYAQPVVLPLPSALVATSNTSLLSLHLPTPSPQILNPLSRGQSTATQTKLIPEDSGKLETPEKADFTK